MQRSYAIKLADVAVMTCIEGVSLPTDEWVKAMQNLNEKTRKLQEEYEADCVKQKVSAYLDYCVPFHT